MNDALKEFWTELKERATNPFFGSFVLSWLIINYPIPITLLFYKKEDLKPDYTSFLDVIAQHTSLWHMAGLPILVALFYTFVFPFFKEFVKVFLTERSLNTDRKIQNISNLTTVPLERFISTQLNLKNKELELKNLIIEEGTTLQENEALKLKINELQTGSRQLTLDNDKKINEVNALNDERVKNLLKDHEKRVVDNQKEFQQLLDSKTQKEAQLLSTQNLMLSENERLNDQIQKMSADLENLNKDREYIIAERDAQMQEFKTANMKLREQLDHFHLTKVDHLGYIFINDERAVRMDNRQINDIALDTPVYVPTYGWGRMFDVTVDMGVKYVRIRFENGLQSLPLNKVELYVKA